MLKILAFGYEDRCGKDTAANYIHQTYFKDDPNFHLISLATPLKSISYEMFSYAGLQRGEFYEIEENKKLKDTKLPSINKTPRDIWILCNLFKQIDPKVWIVNALKEYIYANENKILLIRDLRFKCEIEYLKSLDNSISVWYKVDRKDSGDSSTNISDLKDSDFEGKIINNNKDLKHLYKQLDILTEQYLQ